MAYKDLKAPKKDMEELDEDLMMEDLDLEADLEEPEMSDLTSISDEELMAELKSRGLLEDDMDEDEEELDFEEA